MAKRVTAPSLKRKSQDLGLFLIQDIEALSDLIEKTTGDKFNFSAAQRARVLSIKITNDLKLWRRLSMDYLLAYRAKK